MATINAGNPTLADVGRRLDPNGSIANIVEILYQQNVIAQDSVWKEGNLPTGELLSMRTGLPSVGWRRFNEGIAGTKSRVDQFTETCGQMEANSIVDVGLAKINGNEAAFRASEDTAFIQALGNELEVGFFYHSTKTSPEKFMGLTPRLDASTNPFGGQIVKHNTLQSVTSSGANQSSIWLVRWGLDSVYMMYPKGSTAGLQHNDLGVQFLDDGTLSTPAKRLRAYVTNWNWQVGLVVKNALGVVRICNIDSNNSLATGNAIVNSMVRAFHQIPPFLRTNGKLVFYVNRFIGTLLHLQAMNSVTNSTLSIKEIGGQPITHLLGIPVRETDALVNTEAVVT